MKDTAQLFFVVFLDLLSSDFFRNMRFRLRCVHKLLVQCTHYSFILKCVICCSDEQQKWKNKTKIIRYEIFTSPPSSTNHLNQFQPAIFRQFFLFPLGQWLKVTSSLSQFHWWIHVDDRSPYVLGYCDQSVLQASLPQFL